MTQGQIVVLDFSCVQPDRDPRLVLEATWTLGEVAERPWLAEHHAEGVAHASRLVMAATEDVNREARKNIILANADSVTVLLGSDQTFTPAPGSPVRAGPGAYRIDVGDVNEDGRLDVVASSFERSVMTLLVGG